MRVIHTHSHIVLSRTHTHEHTLLLPPMRVIYSPVSYMSHIWVYRSISIYKTGESNKDIYIYIYIYLVDLLSRLIYESYMAAHGGHPTLNI